jgi:hypothetical protein
MNGFDPADPLISTDYSGWWQRSFRMVKAAWRPMAVVQLIVTLPALAAYLPAMVIVAEKQREALDGVESPGLSALFAGWQVFLPTAVAAVVLLLLGQLATQQVVVHLATGRPGNPVGPALLAGLKRFPMLIGWSLLSLPVLIVALVLCFFPVIYVAAALTVLPVVVLLERGTGIGRCFQLFHATIGVSISRIATIFGLGLAGAMAVTLLQTLVDTIAPADAATVVNSVLDGGYSIISYVILAPLLVTTYADMRARREPFTTADLAPASR